MRYYKLMRFRLPLLLSLLAVTAFAQPRIGAVVNGAAFREKIAAGSLLAIFGTNLSAATVAAPSLPLPTTLNGISIVLTSQQGQTPAERTLPLYYVSAGQVNAVLPPETQPGRYTLALNTSTTRVQTDIEVNRNPMAAADFFTRDGSGRGLALMTDTNFQVIEEGAPGQVVILWATGLGPVDASGRTVRPVELTTGGEVLYAGLSGWPGVYQINVRLQAIPSIDNWLESSMTGAPLAWLNLTRNRNATGVKGDCDFAWPLPASRITFWPIMLMRRNRLEIDISPNAEAFSVSARGLQGSYDPAAEKFVFTARVPWPAWRNGDFSNGRAGQTYDILGRGPFPGSIVPTSRLDPEWARVIQRYPVPGADSDTVGWEVPAPKGKTAVLEIPTFDVMMWSNLPGKEFPTACHLTVDGYRYVSKPQTVVTQ